MQVPPRPGPTQTIDIICVDTPIGEAVEKSSSYNLSIFSSGADSRGAEVVTAMCDDSSPSVVELWPDIDKLDKPSCGDTSVVRTRDSMIRGKRSDAPVEDADRRSGREGKWDSLSDVAGTFDIGSKGCVEGSARKDTVRILSAAPGAISPRIQMSLLDRCYSPSTGMGPCELEIVLNELIRAGYIVKKEPDDNH
jgi:hypothetical protein